jgi:hypothetical protein
MSNQEKNEQDKNQDYHKYSSGTGSDYEEAYEPSSARDKGNIDKIVGKISTQQDMNNNLSESARVSNNVRTVILGLFALIGFIILVFAVFTAGVGGQLNQVQFANSVFIASIVGAFTLVGVIVYQIRGVNGR